MHKYVLAVQKHLNDLGVAASFHDTNGKLFLTVDVPTQSPKGSYGAVVAFAPGHVSVTLNTQVSQWVIDSTGNNQVAAKHGFESCVGSDGNCCLYRMITMPGLPVCLIESTLWDMAECADAFHLALAAVISPAA